MAILPHDPVPEDVISEITADRPDPNEHVAFQAGASIVIDGLINLVPGSINAHLTRAVADEIFDTTLADTLHATGDALDAAAADALRHAQAAPSEDDKWFHRNQAETLLLGAYSLHNDAARRDSPWNARKARSHRRAADAALCISVISRFAGRDGPAQTYATRALDHFTEYLGYADRAAQNGANLNRAGVLAGYAAEVVTVPAGLIKGIVTPTTLPRRLSDLRDYFQSDSRLPHLARRRLDDHRAAGEDLVRQRNRFEQLYTWLCPTPPGSK